MEFKKLSDHAREALTNEGTALDGDTKAALTVFKLYRKGTLVRGVYDGKGFSDKRLNVDPSGLKYIEIDGHTVFL